MRTIVDQFGIWILNALLIVIWVRLGDIRDLIREQNKLIEEDDDSE